MKKIICRMIGCHPVKYGRVDGFDNEIEFPAVSDDECYRLGEVPEHCRKWCSFEVRCKWCGNGVIDA